jgi:hypothetical protein
LFCAVLLWISTESRSTSYGVIAAQMVAFGIGMGLSSAPAPDSGAQSDGFHRSRIHRIRSVRREDPLPTLFTGIQSTDAAMTAA